MDLKLKILSPGACAPPVYVAPFTGSVDCKVELQRADNKIH